jgi:hypothetical protein
MGNSITLSTQLIEDYGSIRLSKIGSALQMYSMKHSFDQLMSPKLFQANFEIVFGKQTSYHYQQYSSSWGVSGLEVFSCLYLLCEYEELSLDEKLDALVALFQFNPIPDLVVSNFTYNKPDDFVLIDQVKLMFQCVVFGVTRLAGMKRLPTADAINSVAEQFFSTMDGFVSKLDWTVVKYQILGCRPVFEFLEQFVSVIYVPSLSSDLATVCRNFETQASFAFGYATQQVALQDTTDTSCEGSSLPAVEDPVPVEVLVVPAAEVARSASQSSVQSSQFGTSANFRGVKWSENAGKSIIKRPSLISNNYKKYSTSRKSSIDQNAVASAAGNSQRKLKRSSGIKRSRGSRPSKLGTILAQLPEVPEEKLEEAISTSPFGADIGHPDVAENLGESELQAADAFPELTCATALPEDNARLSTVSEVSTGSAVVRMQLVPQAPAKPVATARGRRTLQTSLTAVGVDSDDICLLSSVSRTPKQIVTELLCHVALTSSAFGLDYKELAVLDKVTEAIVARANSFDKHLFSYLCRIICAFNIVSSATTNDNHIPADQIVPLIRLCYQSVETETQFQYADDTPHHTSQSLGPSANEIRLMHEINVTMIELGNYRQRQQDLVETLKCYGGYNSTNISNLQPTAPARPKSTSASTQNNRQSQARNKQQQQQGAHSNPNVRSFAASLMSRSNINLSRRGWFEIRLSKQFQQLHDLKIDPEMDTPMRVTADHSVNKLQQFWQELVLLELLVYQSKLVHYFKACVAFKLRLYPKGIPAAISAMYPQSSANMQRGEYEPTYLIEHGRTLDVYLVVHCQQDVRELIISTLTFTVEEYMRVCNNGTVQNKSETERRSFTDALAGDRKEPFVLSDVISQSSHKLDNYIDELVEYCRRLMRQ